MEAPKGAAVAGERKAVTSIRSQSEGGCDAPGSVDLVFGENGYRGAEGQKRSTLLIAVLCAAHAGGEQGWESGHLEPFLLSSGEFVGNFSGS
jgi:hypothetical protein